MQWHADIAEILAAHWKYVQSNANIPETFVLYWKFKHWYGEIYNGAKLTKCKQPNNKNNLVVVIVLIANTLN